MTLHRLSILVAMGLAVLTFWMVISRPGVVDPEFAVTIHVAVVVLVSVVFGVIFLALRFGTAGAAIYWSTSRSDQVLPIVWMILTILGVMMAVHAGLHWLDRSEEMSFRVTYLLAWTLVPAGFLQFKFISWPSRLSDPGKPKLVLIGGLSLCLAAAWSYAAFSLASSDPTPLALDELIVTLGAVLLGASLEEIVVRVLLLTALLDRTGSRFQAVFLSGVAFGLMHVPGTLADPALHGDWVLFQSVAYEYAPGFLLQTLLGLFFGMLWLQTGSITLIALTHAIFNVGSTIVSGY